MLQTQTQLRAEVRTWLEEHWTTDVQAKVRTDPAQRRAWLGKVVLARWAVPRWPVEWLGRASNDEQARTIEREFAGVGAPGAGQDRTNLWANTVLAFGTTELKVQVLRALLQDEVAMCLLYSEPGAGSDLAGVRTRAESMQDGWLVNGQKVWTSGAATADYGMLIARTDWSVPKHQGLSFFFCPMKQPGI